MSWWGYWPIALWLGLTVASVGTALTVKAIVSIRAAAPSFWFWFAVISSWGSMQLVFEFWFSGWVERHFLHPDQRKGLYQKISPGGGMLVDWIEREFYKLYHAKINGAGYAKIIAFGICPRIPKLPLAFICWGKRAWGGFALLALANILRVALELKLGLKAVETLGVSGVLFVIALGLLWMIFQKKVRKK